MPEEKRLTPEEFVLKALEDLKDPRYKGIHSVFSGFNDGFRLYFDGLDPVETTKKMAAAGQIVVHPAKRGVMIYPMSAGVAPIPTAAEALDKMGLGEKNEKRKK